MSGPRGFDKREGQQRSDETFYEPFGARTPNLRSILLRASCVLGQMALAARGEADLLLIVGQMAAWQQQWQTEARSMLMGIE